MNTPTRLKPTSDRMVVIVTGAASGIGRATALVLAQRGANVVVAEHCDDVHGQEAAAEIVAAGGVASAFQHCDVSSAADVDELIHRR